MRKLKLVLLMCLCLQHIRAQDSSKVITHEAGVNIFAMLGQFNIFVPSENQLPYDFFYNLYYKRVGLRTGLGIETTRTETDIEGQQTPRITTSENTNWRVGLSYQVILYKKMAINVFGDYIYQRVGLESSTTTTIQTFPNPVTTRTVRSSDITMGKGAQAGIGLMLYMNRHLSLYTETPITWMVQDRKVEDLVRESGETDISTTAHTTSSGIKIALPVTIYLVFRI